MVAVEMQATGINWEIDAFDRLVFRRQQRSFESSLLIFPTSSAGVWASSDVILTTPDRNFTVDEYPEFFRAIGYADGQLKLEALRAAAEYNWLDRDIGVPVYCFYSTGLSTPERLVYESAFPNSEYRLEMGEAIELGRSSKES